MDSDFENEKPKKTPRKSVAGRVLMRWNPDVDQLLLLTVDHVCVKNNISIPWDEVAKEITPHLTGEAIKQHLAKVHFFRKQNGHPVPEKLDKGARRRLKQGNAANPKTPAKVGPAKKIKGETEDGDPATVVKGANLLWTAPPKKTKTPKSGKDVNPDTPTTARRTGPRKKNAADSGSGEALKNTTTSTGKRGRKKQTVIKDEEDDLSEYDSPTKKAKTISPRQQHDEKALSLRPKVELDYNEHIDSDDDIYDAQQEDSGDETYEEMHRSPPDTDMKSAFDSSQGTADTVNVPPPGSVIPDNAGYHMNYGPSASSIYTHPNKGDVFGIANISHDQSYAGGLPHGMLQQLTYANSINHGAGPMPTLGGFGGNYGALPNIIGFHGYGAYPPEIPDSNIYNDARREQNLRDAINKTMLTAPQAFSVDDAAVDGTQKVKTPRKKAPPKPRGGSAAGTPTKKRTLNAGTPKGNAVATAGAIEDVSEMMGKYEPVMKTETTAPSANEDVFYGSNNTSGMIPITNDTGFGNDFDVGSNMNIISGGMGLMLNIPINQARSTFATDGSYFNDFQTGSNLSYNAHFNTEQPAPITASPRNIFAPALGFHDAHTGVTPQINRFNMESFSNSFDNPQLSLYPSQSNSFSSIKLTQSKEAAPGFDQDGDPNSEPEWNSNEYERQYPDDEFANMGGVVDPDMIY